MKACYTYTYIGKLEALTQYSTLPRLLDDEDVTRYCTPVRVNTSTAARLNRVSSVCIALLFHRALRLLADCIIVPM